MRPKIIMLLCFWMMPVFATLSTDNFLPAQGLLVPGGVAVVDLGLFQEPPEVYFQQERVALFKNKETQAWSAIVGLPLSLQNTSRFLEVFEKRINKWTKINIQVGYKEYTSQSINIKNKHYVNPDHQDLIRIDREGKRFNHILKQWAPKEIHSFALESPVKAPISSVFGSRRIINGEARSPHKGVDFAAPRGTLVYAAGSGEIVESANYFYTGNTVVVDHGQGFQTLYCHLDVIYVTVGQTVASGVPIGTVGITGRATGPHLHFGVSLNNVRVDPVIFLRDLNI